MSEIILHQYPQSPVAEKVRVGLGIKNLSWRSVEIPRLPPKPDLIPLTGGYRRTPVMQIGADIYCDSQCILRELEHRYPSPGYYPADEHYSGGIPWALTRWTDDRLFAQCIKVVLAGAGDDLPADFAEDRGRLYFGPEWQTELKAARNELQHTAAQLRAQFAWLNDWLAGNRNYLLGDTAGVVDACAYHLVWFIRGRWAGGEKLLSEFPYLQAWEASVKLIGHGISADLSATEALAIARDTQTTTPESADVNDPQELTPGTTITIAPDIDGGEVAVSGTVHAVSADTISVLRDSPQTGQVCVHFPRVGYRVNVV